jgi:hypothetical protein
MGAAKLSAKYFRPYQILDKVGLASYCLQLSAHAKIHNVFHVVFLKKFEGMPPLATPPLLCTALRWQHLGNCWCSGTVGKQQKLHGRR